MEAQVEMKRDKNYEAEVALDFLETLKKLFQEFTTKLVVDLSAVL
jgi:hypothetical protein